MPESERTQSGMPRILYELATAGEPLAVSDLRKRTGATRAATRQTLRRLRQRDYVAKVGAGQSTQWLIRFPEEETDE